MKKLLPVLLVVLAVGGGAYFFLGKKDSTSPGSSVSDKFSGSLKAATALGVPMKCTYTVEGTEYEGWVKGENYRGKIKSADGKSGEIIMKDNCMWSWSEGETQGIKTCFDPADTEEVDGDVWDQPQGADGTDISYTCLPAVITDAQFTPPSDIEFLDLESLIQGFGVQ